MDTSTRGTVAMIELLAAGAPDLEHVDELMLFGRLVGSWDVEATYFDHDGSRIGERQGEWHFGWILEGRAIQDVLFGPPLEERRRTGAPPHEYGTTIRLYDPTSGTWKVSWYPSMSRKVVHLAARPDEDGIVLEGSEDDGTLDRWEFREMTDDSFTWLGYESKDGGTSWPLVERMLVRRRGSRAGDPPALGRSSRP
jgi:hypothetical protein